jgi:hypothetical protein
LNHPQEVQDLRDLTGSIFIQSVHSNQRVQDQELRVTPLNRLDERFLVGLGVEPEDGRPEHTDRDAFDSKSSMPADICEPVGRQPFGTFERSNKDLSWVLNLEATKERSACGDGNREFGD